MLTRLKLKTPRPFFFIPVFFITLSALVVFIFSASSSSAYGRSSPLMKNGILDLRGWDFGKDGIVNLSGQWKFYWQKHVSPERINSQALSSTSTLITTPGAWNGHALADKKISSHGFATYYARVLLDPHHHHLALKLLDMATSYRLYINGRQIDSSGFPGQTKETTTPAYHPGVVEFETHSAQLDIVVHVSNFHHWQGGFWEPLLLGSVKKIRTTREHRLVVMFLLLGSIFIIGAYHLVLFGFRPTDKSTLYFGIFCLLISIRVLCSGERYITHLFPTMSYEILMKAIYLSFYLCVPFFTMYARLLFPKEFSNAIITIIKIVCLFFSGCVLFLPAAIYTYSMPVFQIFTLLILIYGIWVMFQSVIKKRQGSCIFTIGMIILSLSTVNDILYSRQIISTGLFVPYGLLFFMFSQAVLIARKFSAAFSISEKQKIELLMTNTAYKNELTQKKRAQTALEKSEKQFKNLFNSITDLIYTQDMQGRFTSANKSMQTLFGYDATELIGRCVTDFMKPEFKSQFITGFLDVIKQKGYKQGVSCYFKKNGEKIYIEYKSFLVNHEGETPYISGIGQDVTERILSEREVQKLQKQILQSQKMEAIGTLAGGVAHDFNNILSSIFGYAQLAEAHLNEPETAKKDLHKLIKGAQRASDVVRQILTYSRQSDYTKSPLVLANLLAEVLKLLRSSIPPNIEIKKKILSRSIVMADQTQVHQVIMNLCTNAYHAMKEKGGTMTVTLTDTEISGQERTTNLDNLPENISPGNYIKLEIKDTGHGIERKIMDKIFDPYFTTKEIGKGTGMGLAMIDGIVKNHNGYINVFSEVGQGASFQVFWPIIEKNHTHAIQD